jgi:hypothetical protein
MGDNMKKNAINLVIFFFLTVMIIGCSSNARRVVFKSTQEPDITADIAFPPHGEFWYVQEGRPIEMESAAGDFEASVGQGFKRALLFSSQDKFAIVVPNTNAILKFDKGISTFYTRKKPTEMGMVRFTLQPEKNRRYILVDSPVGADVGFFYPESDEISFSYAKMPSGIYRITLTKPLTAGEYGIIATGGATGYIAYSFSISGSR